MAENIFTTITDAQIRDNIRESWKRADAACRRYGRTWYPKTHELTRDLANAAGLSVDTVAAIIAVLSPRSAWPTNVKNAAAVLVEAGHLSLDKAVSILFAHGYGRDPVVDTLNIAEGPRGLGGSITKARMIVSAEAPADFVTGQKVRSFYHNIADPKHSNDVTIDAWAAGVAMGRRLNNAEMSGLNTKQYTRIADQYRIVARELRMRALNLQAACWCEMRGSSR